MAAPRPPAQPPAARRYGEVETQSLETLRRRPQDAVAPFNLGFAGDRQSKRREAIEGFARAAALDPGTDAPGTARLPPTRLRGTRTAPFPGAAG